MRKRLLFWLVAAGILTVIFGTIYGVGQQVLRMGANDPQIQLAEDIAARLDEGADPVSFTSSKVDVARSLSPFLIIYDKDGNELASAATLGDKTPQLPKGVLDHAMPHNRVTWEPKSGVRIAAVVQASQNGYVLAGRNMREIENREGQVLLLVVLGWFVSEIALIVGGLCSTWKTKNGKKTKK